MPRTVSLIITSPSDPASELDRLRVELVELAFTLDRRGQCEAADVATMVAARLAELLPLKPGGGG